MLSPTMAMRKVPKPAPLGVLAAILPAAALLLGAQPASARAACTTHDRVTEQLEKRFSEAPVSYGLASNGKLVEVFSSSDGTTWTIVLTAPEGVSCVIASGKFWENLPPKEELGPAA